MEAYHRTGWYVEIEVDSAYMLDPDEAQIGPGRITVLDRGSSSGPRTLWGVDGERMIIPLYARSSPIGEYGVPLWAALPTDDGLRFIGPDAEYFGFNLEMPLLCHFPRTDPIPEALDRDTDTEWDLIVSWTEGIAAGTETDEALWAACGVPPQDPIYWPELLGDGPPRRHVLTGCHR